MPRRRLDSWDTLDTDSGKSPYEGNMGKFPGTVSQPSQLSSEGPGSQRPRRPSKNRAKTVLAYAHRLDLDAGQAEALFREPPEFLCNVERGPGPSTPSEDPEELGLGTTPASPSQVPSPSNTWKSNE